MSERLYLRYPTTLSTLSLHVFSTLTFVKSLAEETPTFVNVQVLLCGFTILTLPHLCDEQFYADGDHIAFSPMCIADVTQITETLTRLLRTSIGVIGIPYLLPQAVGYKPRQCDTVSAW